MGRPACGEQVKLSVHILVVASGCHARLVGLETLGKARLTFHWLRVAPPPREHAEIHADVFANEMPFLGKQFLLRHAEHLGKEFNLFAGCRTAQSFDVGQDFPRHVDATEQMQFGDEIAL